MEQKLEGLFNKIETLVENWVKELETNPIKAGLRVLVVLYIIKFIRKGL